MTACSPILSRMSEISDNNWPVRTLVAAGIAVVVLGLGAGAALGSVGGDTGRGGPGGFGPGQGRQGFNPPQQPNAANT
jgi:hypothetical protein